MLADFAGIAIAFLLFSFLTVLPGYTLAWALDLLRFRRREPLSRLAIGVSLAIAIGPLMSYLTGQAAWAIYFALSVAAVPLMFKARRKFEIAWPVVAWCVLAVLVLCDLQFGRRLYFSIIGFDYAVRTAFVSSISAFGLPAQNPFFYPGAPVALRYHYYWLIQSALVHRVASPLVDARQALIAGTIWCGIGLLSLIALYLRFFKVKGRKSSTLLAFGLLLVTGLDILPALLFLVLAKMHLIGNLPPSMEWWNDQVDGWLYSMVWEPHYISGVIACLFGFLVISQSQNRRVLSGVVAGLAFATSVGAAIYVAFVFAIFLSCWTAVAAFKRWYGEVVSLSVAGVTALLCSLPFLKSLRGPGTGGAFSHWTVRSFSAIDVFSKVLHWSPIQTDLANLLVLPLNYFLELGLFFAVGILECRRLRKMPVIQRDDLALAVMTFVTITVCTFLRSGVISNNDLGWRGFLIAQFVLLIRGAQLLSAQSLRQSKRLTVLAALGLAGTVYDQALLRFYPMLSDAKLLPKVGWLAIDEKLGERTYANREAYEWIRAHSDPRTRIQQSPDQPIQDTFYGLYANRNTLDEDIACATTFGGDPKDCLALQKTITPMFDSNASEQAFESACATEPMEFVIAKDTDASWRSQNTWVWRRSPEFANSYVRVFRCGPQTNKLLQSQRGGPLFRR